MPNYKTVVEYVDAYQWEFDEDDTPELGVIPPGAIKKKFYYHSSEGIPDEYDKYVELWGVDTKYNFISLKKGDWIVKRKTSRFHEIYKNDDFHDKFEKLIW